MMERKLGNWLSGKMTIKSTIIFGTVCLIVAIGIILIMNISDSDDITDILGTYVCENEDSNPASTITIVLNKGNKCTYTFLANTSGAVPSTTEYCSFEVKDGKVLLTAKFKYADEFTNDYTLYPYGEYMIHDFSGCFYNKMSN